MIIPCIDLMDGKVVQLVQGRDKAFECDSPQEMLRKFAFHFGTYTVGLLKETLAAAQIPVRLTTTT